MRERKREGGRMRVREIELVGVRERERWKRGSVRGRVRERG